MRKKHVWLLDIVEVPDSHTGEHLAKEIDAIQQAFKVKEKVSEYTQCSKIDYSL